MTTQTAFLLPAASFFPMAAALISYCIGRKSKHSRNIFADAAAAAELLLLTKILLSVIDGTELKCTLPRLLGGLLFEADSFRALYACIAGFMWLCTTVFSEEYLAHYRNRNRYYFFTLLTLGSTVGVFFSAELLTTFLFFEIMSFTSYVMVIHDEAPSAMQAGQTYLAVAVLGGMVMLMGLLLLYRLIGTLVISELTAACTAVPAKMRPRLYLSGSLIFFGFGAKAGMYPLHIWLPKAHPAAPAPASALLSGILTKAGIFGILVLSCRIFPYDRFWGSMLLALAVLTMFTGAFIAVFSVNLKRTLACSSVSQIGFILTAVSMQCLLREENSLAVWGTVLHMMNHSLFKLVLFLSAGAIYMKCHQLDLNSIRGYGRGKPMLMLIFLSAALGIAGVPLFSGYISKTLIHESLVEYIEILAERGSSIALMKGIEWVFLLSGGLTAAYMIKLFVAVFLEKNADEKLQEQYDGIQPPMKTLSTLSIGIPALLFPIFGSFPDATMVRFAELSQSFMNGALPEHAIHWFSSANLKGAAISLAIGAAVYFGFIRTFLMQKNAEGIRCYADRWPSGLDIENRAYRTLSTLLAKAAVSFSSAAASLPDGIITFFRRTLLQPIPIQEDVKEEQEENACFPYGYSKVLFCCCIIISTVLLLVLLR
jgi:hydrogenase-4 component B